MKSMLKETSTNYSKKQLKRQKRQRGINKFLYKTGNKLRWLVKKERKEIENGATTICLNLCLFVCLFIFQFYICLYLFDNYFFPLRSSKKFSSRKTTKTKKTEKTKKGTGIPPHEKEGECLDCPIGKSTLDGKR